MTELFKHKPEVKPIRGPHTAHSAPDTSRAAAEIIAPVAPNVRTRVANFAKRAGRHGVTDAEIFDAFEAVSQNTLRPRRTELVEANILINMGATRKNDAGRDCVVWVHRDFVPSAVPVADIKKKPSPTIAEREAVCAYLRRIERPNLAEAIWRGDHLS